MSATDSIQTNLPKDLQTVLDDLDRADADALRLMDGVTDAQANWQPRENAWSMAQCLDHLARTNVAYVAALRDAVRDGGAAGTPRREPIRPGWVSRYFIRTVEPPPRSKFRAPKKIVPRPQADKDEVLQLFLRSQENVRALVRDSAGLDLNRIRFRNPFVWFLRFTVGAGFLIIAAHDRLHLWQAEQVRQAVGFRAQ
ncbi:MAG TPA: DinB family protein [Candidatus Acidoferrales bacterium]|nr:DinB family protein [Candidatus Acidoferrales bacterium]